MRHRWESFLPGQGLGGSFVHWNGQSFRAQVADFTYRSHLLQRYGKKFVEACGPELTVQDWGVTYDELEPHYDRFEHLIGVCGKAGNIKGQIQPGGNPFEAPRARDYPNPPMKETYFGAIFRKGAESLGYHPYPQPSSNMSRLYTNPLGLKLQPCVFCGFCERYACEHFAKGSPQTTILPVLMKNPNYELRTNCEVLRINLDSTGKKATGVTYVDGAGREFEQPAEMVFITAFPLNNVRTLLLSGIGKPYDLCPTARYLDGKPPQLFGPRPNLQGRVGSAVAAHDLRFRRKRCPHVAVHRGQGGRDRPRDGRQDRGARRHQAALHHHHLSKHP
jgi:gluconate 2-dehydrogenase alpha chain